MDIYCSNPTSVRLRGKKTVLVIDPTASVEADAVLLTGKNLPHVQPAKVKNARVTVDGPGEYEVGGVSIVGKALGEVTTYYIKIDGMTILHLGSIDKPLSDTDFDTYPSIDVLLVPVMREVSEMVAKFEPKVVVPIAFDQASLAEFLKEMGKDGIKSQPKLSITKEKLPAELEVVVLG